MEARTDGNTPWPEYTNAMMPNTSGIVAQLPSEVAAPAGNPPAQTVMMLGSNNRCSVLFRVCACLHVEQNVHVAASRVCFVCADSERDFVRAPSGLNAGASTP